MTSHPSRPTRRRRAHIIIACRTASLAAALLSSTGMGNMAVAAFLVPYPRVVLRHRQYYTTTRNNKSSTTQSLAPKHSPLEDEPWQKGDSYWDQLQTASKDPEAFEKFIEESMARKKKSGKSSLVSSSAANGVNGDTSTTDDSKPKKKGKYVPIEEWDSQRTPENMSAEERLQWECQRSGNQFRQNEILQHHLNSF